MQDDFDLLKLNTKPSEGKKKRINSHGKGGNFARKICKIFNERFNTKEFSKTPGSGAYATTHDLPEHLKIYGDIITPKDFKFVIECKCGYPKINLNSLLKKDSQFWEFIRQVEIDSKKAKKEPMLIFQQDRQEPLVFTTWGEMDNYSEAIIIGNYAMMELKTFLKNIPDQDFTTN